MENETLISVIVPVYNVEKYLKRCVESLINQTYKNLEIILVDDGAKDSSGAICDELAAEDNRIRVIHKQNGGLSSARNSGLDVIRGEFCTFVDSDDFLELNTIEVAIKSLNEFNCDVAVYGRFDDYENGSSRQSFTCDKAKSFDKETAIRKILTWDEMDIAACDKVYKASLLEGVRFPEGKNNEDICVVPTIFSRAKACVHVGLPLYHYCHRSGSISTSSSVKQVHDISNAINMMENQLRELYDFEGLQNELVFYKNRQYLLVYKAAVENNYKGEELIIAKSFLKVNWKQSKAKMDKTSKVLYLLLRLRVYKAIRWARRLIKG